MLQDGIMTAESCCRRHLNAIRAPLQVPKLHGIEQLALGGSHSLAVRHTGQLLAWGSNQNGVLGLGRGNSSDAATPTLVPKIFCDQVGLEVL